MHIASKWFVLVLGLLAFSAHAAVCSVGDRADVKWKGTWYKANVTKVNEDQSRCFIRYEGYGSEWDEWVCPDRIRILTSGGSLEEGSAVECRWKNGSTWFPGVIEEKTGRKVFIHYNDGDKEDTTGTAGLITTAPSAFSFRGAFLSPHDLGMSVGAWGN